MFGSVSFNEIMVILVIALIIFGPKRLPQIGRTVGKALGEFRRASSDLKRTMETEMSNIDKEVAATPSPSERIAPVAAVERRSEPVAAPPVAGAPPAEAAPVEAAPVETVVEEPAGETAAQAAEFASDATPAKPSDPAETA